MEKVTQTKLKAVAKAVQSEILNKINKDLHVVLIENGDGHFTWSVTDMQISTATIGIMDLIIKNLYLTIYVLYRPNTNSNAPTVQIIYDLNYQHQDRGYNGKMTTHIYEVEDFRERKGIADLNLIRIS